MKKASYAATHYGECQLCGHEQKLPYGGFLSQHGYSVLWNSFQGVCSGSKHLPYEKSCDLLKGEIARQREVIAGLEQFRAKITAPSFTDVFVSEPIPSQYRMGRHGPSTLPRRLTAAQYKIEERKSASFTLYKLTWQTMDRPHAASTQQQIQKTDATSRQHLISLINAREVADVDANIANRRAYIKWLKERITKFVVRDLKPVPVEDQGTKATTMHMLNAYFSKKTGRPTAMCVSSYQGAQVYKATTADRGKITCKACLKALAAADADEKVEQQAKALVAEMVAKHGERATVRFSDSSEAAIKEVRFQRKDVDKAVRQRACRLLGD